MTARSGVGFPMEYLTCSACDKTFLGRTGNPLNRRFCSDECRRSPRGIEGRSGVSARPCRGCGVTLPAIPPTESPCGRGIKRPMFCSDECRDKVKARRAIFKKERAREKNSRRLRTLEADCVICGSKFVYVLNVNGVHRKYCSEVCRQKAKGQNRRSYPDYDRARRKELKDVATRELAEYKTAKGCKVCGESRWWVLDFHHNGKDKKSGEISRMAKRGLSPTVMKEIDKCDLLCANCHRDVHHKARMKEPKR